MDPKNFNFLSERFTALGFDGVFNQVMKANMALGKPEFSLLAETLTKDGTIRFSFNLSHAKKETSHPKDYYFLQNVDVKLTNKNNEQKVHNFLLFKQTGYHHDQMIHLMAGRSICEQFRQDGRQVDLSRRIDFESLDQYNNTTLRTSYKPFDAMRELNKLPFTRIDQKEKERIVKDLRDGYEVAVELKQGANVEKMTLVAVPHLGAIYAYNAQGEKVSFTNNNMRVVTGETQSVPEMTQQMMQAEQQGQGKENTQQRGERRKIS